MREMTAPAKVDKQGRVTIPPVIRETLMIKEGDLVELTVRKILMENGKSGNPQMANALEPIPA